MLAVHCPTRQDPSRRVLVSMSDVVSMTDDGAGTITVVVRCASGHEHRLVTGRAQAARPAARQVAAAC